MVTKREIAINEKISYIECSKNPLSADIGIIRENGVNWLYDVGCGEKNIAGLKDEYNVVLSHFHQDHMGNIDKINSQKIYLSKETYKHVGRGIIVDSDVYIGGLHIFPMPSSHAKGCIGLEVDETYAFVGDAIYSKSSPDGSVYNVQLLKDAIKVLKELKSQYLLVSHFKGLVRNKDEVIAGLEMIYQKRKKNQAYIMAK